MQRPTAALQLSCSLEELEAQIGELSANIDAASCRLLLCIAEFDRREGWSESGFRCCAHWLGWRIGLDRVTAREQVRVGRALEKLPRIRAEFAAGRVSYSKVRAMTRVATPENEQELLEVARHGTAAQLERLTRLFRAGSSAEERDGARRQHAQRYLRTWTDADGMLCVQGRLPPELGAMVKEALGAALRALGEQTDQKMAAPGASAEAPEPVPVTTDAAPEQDEAEVAGELRCEAEADEADEADADDAEAERELEESSRGTLVSFGAAPRVQPLVELAPEVREQRTADALGLVAQWALAQLVQPTEQAGARPAPQERLEPCGREGRFEVVLHVDAQVLAEDAPVGRCEIEKGPRVSAETMRRLCCSAPTVTLLHGKDGELLGPGRRTRRIPAPLWRALRSRDQRCAWPGCEARHRLVVHHVEHWAKGGATRLPNLVCLCKSHHWALHEGGFRLEGRAPDALVLFTPDGRVLAGSPAPLEGDALELMRHNQQLGLTIDSETGLTRWQGEPMDYDWALASLTRRSPNE